MAPRDQDAYIAVVLQRLAPMRSIISCRIDPFGVCQTASRIVGLQGVHAVGERCSDQVPELLPRKQCSSVPGTSLTASVTTCLQSWHKAYRRWLLKRIVPACSCARLAWLSASVSSMKVQRYCPCLGCGRPEQPARLFRYSGQAGDLSERRWPRRCRSRRNIGWCRRISSALLVLVRPVRLQHPGRWTDRRQLEADIAGGLGGDSFTALFLSDKIVEGVTTVNRGAEMAVGRRLVQARGRQPCRRG